MTDSKSIRVNVREGENILLLSDDNTESDQQSCVDLLSLIDPSQANLLVVTFQQSPDKWFQRWIRTIGERPANMAVVAVGETTRSTAVSGIGRHHSDFSYPVETVPATALTEIGISIGRFLTDWEENSNRTIVCFDSLTALLQWTETESAFRFLHVLTTRLDKLNALAHFHCDPSVHGRTTVRILEPLFENVIDVNYHTQNGDISTELENSTIRNALRSERRRIVLRKLIEKPGFIPIRELADAVVSSASSQLNDNSIPATERQRVMTQLHHTDLPKLEDAGLVMYDSTDNVASLSISAEKMENILSDFSNS